MFRCVPPFLQWGVQALLALCGSLLVQAAVLSVLYPSSHFVKFPKKKGLLLSASFPFPKQAWRAPPERLVKDKHEPVQGCWNLNTLIGWAASPLHSFYFTRMPTWTPPNKFLLVIFKVQPDAGAADLLVSHVPICFVDAEGQVLGYDSVVVSKAPHWEPTQCGT